MGNHLLRAVRARDLHVMQEFAGKLLREKQHPEQLIPAGLHDQAGLALAHLTE